LRPVETITSHILVVRGKKVMPDADLAELYGVPTKRFNEQVKRNIERLPDDFMFHISAEEFVALKSQFATSKVGRGGRRYLPYVFTEHSALLCRHRTSIALCHRSFRLRDACVRATS